MLQRCACGGFRPGCAQPTTQWSQFNRTNSVHCKLNQQVFVWRPWPSGAFPRKIPQIEHFLHFCWKNVFLRTFLFGCTCATNMVFIVPLPYILSPRGSDSAETEATQPWSPDPGQTPAVCEPQLGFDTGAARFTRQIGAARFTRPTGGARFTKPWSDSTLDVPSL